MSDAQAWVVAVIVLAAVWLLLHVPGVDQAVLAADPRTCPAGTFLAADGFCTTQYHYIHPTPSR